MKKTGTQTPSRPAMLANQAAAASNTETTSLPTLRQERQRLLQEVQTISADLDAQLDALANGLTQ